jgi:aspartyl-tRNA(Asn)/glutamyl-tRNA(Gln) amidotransferase subunit A
LVAFGSSLDQVGPMARSVADLSAIYDVIHGHDPRDATSARLSREQVAAETQASSQDWKSGDRPVRLGVPQEFFVEGVDAPVRRAVESALEHFRSVGCELVPISLPHLVHAIPVYYVIAMAEASSNLSRFDGVRYGTRSDEAAQAQTLHEFYAQARALFGREVKRRILLGSFILSAGYHEAYYRKACQVRRLIANDFQHAFERVDLIVGPVSPTTAFELGSHSRSPLEMYLNDLFTVPANLAGLPALSLPLGSDSRGMPIGLQCIAPAFQERRLLGWAARAEAELASRAVTGSSK